MTAAGFLLSFMLNSKAHKGEHIERGRARRFFILFIYSFDSLTFH